jgi:peptidoglycan LD-endopeptidase CwlK
MAIFGDKSKEKLATCDPRLQALFTEVVTHFDCVVLCGHRSKADQDLAVRSGKSKTSWPNSKHNPVVSLAVDVAPFERPKSPVDWTDRERLTYFAGYVLGIAKNKGIPIRWGGDWDCDTQVRDNTFDDLVHFELISE